VGITRTCSTGWQVDGRVDPVEPHETDVRTETPVMGLLATLARGRSTTSRALAAMKGAFERLRGSYVRGNRRQGAAVLREPLQGRGGRPGGWSG
jgi:hypothetical protein